MVRCRQLTAAALVIASLCTASTAHAGKSRGYAVCARADDPPSCLIAEAIREGTSSPEEVLKAVVSNGSMAFVQRFSGELVAGAWEIHPTKQRDAIAAVALATAAQRSNEPFDDPLVRKLLKAARSKTAAEELAVLIWFQIGYYDGRWGRLARPAGLRSILNALVIKPPDNTDRVANLALDAALLGIDDVALALAKTVEDQSNATANTKASTAGLLANRLGNADDAQHLLDSGGDRATDFDLDGIRVEIAQARLITSPDREAIGIVENDLIKRAGGPAYMVNLDMRPINALQAAGAHDALARLGDLYLAQGRQPERSAEDRGDWLALASTCYQRAGLMDRALQAAREGLPFVPRAVVARTGPTAGDTTRSLTVQANGFGSRPVQQLYRLGAREEALQSGYLSGYERYIIEEELGGNPDPQWVVDDNSEFELKILVLDLLGRPDTQRAQRLDDAVSGLDLEPDAFVEQSWTRRGLIAAMAGRRSRMLDSFAQEASLLKAGQGLDNASLADLALELAENWRMGEIILAQVQTK